MFAKKPAEQKAAQALTKEGPFSKQLSSSPTATKNSFSGAFMERVPPGAEYNSGDGVVIIGKGTRIAGEITNCSKLEIQGSVEGRIGATILVVREGGSVKGEILADDAEINGHVEGQLDVKGLLDIRSTGRVEGDLAYGKLAVAMGGHIAGQIRNADVAVAPIANDAVVPISTHSSFIGSNFERQ